MVKMVFGCDVYDFFWFKQKTAYEMRIRDWSSDVCSSDLRISTWSLLRPRIWKGRVKANVSDIDASGKFSDGTTWSSALPRSMAPDWVSTSAGITSIGTSDSACVRLLMRVPVTTTADRSVALAGFRSEEHTSELQSLMRISYAVFGLKKKKNIT